MKVTYKKYPEIYKVENETFQDIAKKLGIDVFVLQKNNEISNLSKGDYIEIINQNFYVVKPLDTISSISRKLDVKVANAHTKKQHKTDFYWANFVLLIAKKITTSVVIC